jgi:hypothetical protein
MLNIDKNQELITELSADQAAKLVGGYKFIGYDFDTGLGIIAEADRGIPDLKYPDKIDAVYIFEGKWQLFDSDDYLDPIGDPIGPGVHYFTGKRKNTANSLLKVG